MLNGGRGERRKGLWMDFIDVQGYTVKTGKLAEFQAWLAANEKEIRNAAPEGTEYIGTYAVTHTSEKHAGSVRTLWRLDSYGAQDRMAAAGKEDGPFRDLIIEFIAFVDEDSDNWSQTLLKAMVDATVFD